MSQEKTNFTDLALQRPNYFAGQYLLQDDFELQHKYLSDRQKYHFKSLYVSGIIEGLEVESDRKQEAVTIHFGSAIDDEGNLIFLTKEQKFSEFGIISEGELYIEYSEQKDVYQDAKNKDSYTRWKEKPKLGFAAVAPENSVKLTKLTITEGEIALDSSVREYSGLSLPNPKSEALTLRSQGDINSNTAVLSGSLKIDEFLFANSILTQVIESGNLVSDNNKPLLINPKGNNVGIGTTNPTEKLEVYGNIKAKDISADGNLTVTGTISGKIDAKKIISGTLRADRIPDLSANKITSGTINGQLKIEQGIIIDGTRDDHVNLDGAFYRKGGQVYITVDDSLYIRDTGDADKVKIHFDTNEGNLRVNDLNADGNIEAKDIFADGNLTVTGNISGKIDAKKIISGTLYADRIPNLSANKITSETLHLDRIPQLPTNKITWGKINGSLSVTGAITPSVGETETNGIMFPKNPFGGGGDAAWIRYYKRGSAGEATTLEIGTSDGTDDHIALMPKAGNVGIGTDDPKAKLHIKQTVDSSGIRIEENGSDRYFQIAYEGQGNIHFYHKTSRGQWMGSDGKWNHNSDISLKKNILSVHNILNKVLQLNPVYFAWKNNETNDNETNDIGFIAQEVEQVFPELVSSVNISGNDIKGLPYASFGVLAIAAIKDLKTDYDAKIKSLEATITQLVNRQKLS